MPNTSKTKKKGKIMKKTKVSNLPEHALREHLVLYNYAGRIKYWGDFSSSEWASWEARRIGGFVTNKANVEAG